MGVFSRGAATAPPCEGVLIAPNRVNVPVSHRSAQNAQPGSCFMGVFSRGAATAPPCEGVLIAPNRVNVPVSHRSAQNAQGAKRGPDRASRLTGRLLLRHSQVAAYRSQPHTSPGLGPPIETHPGAFMAHQEPAEDLHSKRVATDADYWMSWLERLAEIRRESEREALARAETPVSGS
jgi:hypothetical protein